MNINLLKAISMMLGTTIGAGLFGLPYVVSKSGVIPALICFFLLTFFMIIIHLAFAEINLRTQEKCRLVGLSKMYLGGNFKKLATISAFVGVIGSLLAYIILSGKFLSIVFSNSIGHDYSFYFSLIFALLISIFVIKGSKLISFAEIFTNLIFFSIIAILLVSSFSKISLPNFQPFDTINIFSLYGVILFSLVGMSAVPEATSMLKENKSAKVFKKAIILSFLIILFFYLTFSLIVVGVSGNQTSQDALTGLIPFLGIKLVMLGALAAVVTLADSFVVLALYLKNTLACDYKVPDLTASIFVCLFPIILFLAGFQSFIAVVGTLGAIVGAIDSILIVLIYKKAKKAGKRIPEFSLNIPYFLLSGIAVLFVLGAVSQIF